MSALTKLISPATRAAARWRASFVRMKMGSSLRSAPPADHQLFRLSAFRGLPSLSAPLIRQARRAIPLYRERRVQRFSAYPEATVAGPFDHGAPDSPRLLRSQRGSSRQQYDFPKSVCQLAVCAARSIAAAISRSITGRGLSGSIGSVTGVTSFVCGSQCTGP
jgi:hypothetical protein